MNEEKNYELLCLEDKNIIDYIANALRQRDIYFDKALDLQNRIDKAIDCIEKFPLIHYSSVEKIDGKRLSGKLIPVDELLDILKESGE